MWIPRTCVRGYDDLPVDIIGSILIRIASVDEILDLRWTILRAGLPRDLAHFEGDQEPTTHHFAALQTERAVACATFLRRPFDGMSAWQLRGMAVAPELQGTGVGTRLLDFAEGFVLDQDHSTLLWCNARVPASRFYQRLGWTIVGDRFEIPDAGPHVKMLKQTAPSVR
jgi:GNAT superfamily N-acetyltransferase